MREREADALATVPGSPVPTSALTVRRCDHYVAAHARDAHHVCEDVQVLSATGMTMRCQLQGKVVMVGRLQIMAGTTVALEGDVGRLVLPRWAVQDLGLTGPASR